MKPTDRAFPAPFHLVPVENLAGEKKLVPAVHEERGIDVLTYLAAHAPEPRGEGWQRWEDETSDDWRSRLLSVAADWAVDWAGAVSDAIEQRRSERKAIEQRLQLVEGDNGAQEVTP